MVERRGQEQSVGIRKAAIAANIPLTMRTYENEHVRGMWSRTNDTGATVITESVATALAATNLKELRGMIDKRFNEYKVTILPKIKQGITAEADPAALESYYAETDQHADETTKIEPDRSQELAVAHDLRTRLETLLDPETNEHATFSYIRKQSAILSAKLAIAVIGLPGNAQQNLKARMKFIEYQTNITYDRMKPPTPKPDPSDNEQQRPTFAELIHGANSSIDLIDEVLSENDE